ncbi:hypothetical protein WN51_11872 [Melipona quadrifasciata]|uniref:Uncharacterized protein n=1 Tax=Melipona quadrifasciata TaxID=166423 RepID=A0A0M9A603_9HYME|nr:hypothetical protein WN51_11872 [Melipona quadrifasciata]
MSIQVTFIPFFLYIFHRSLEVFEQYGVKHSELLKAQRIAGGSGLGGPLRYQNCILLWLRCDMVGEFGGRTLSQTLFRHYQKFLRECFAFRYELERGTVSRSRYTETVSGYITIALTVATVTGLKFAEFIDTNS